MDQPKQMFLHAIKAQVICWEGENSIIAKNHNRISSGGVKKPPSCASAKWSGNHDMDVIPLWNTVFFNVSCLEITGMFSELESS